MRDLLRWSPWWPFHLTVAVPAMALLYSVSLPGIGLVTFLVASGTLLAAAAVWLIRGLAFVSARRRGIARGSSAWFLVAPLGGVLVLALVLGSVPLRVRWAMSESDFESWADRAPPESEVSEIVRFDVPSRIGLYRIRQAYRQGEAVIFYEARGSGIVDDAGFAYLPHGPFPQLVSGSFESPTFRHLSGPWYAWTASW